MVREVAVTIHHVQQASNTSVRFQRVAKWNVGVNDVGIAPSLAAACEDARLLKLRDDALDRTLRQPDQVGDVLEARAGVSVEANENMGVVAEEGPMLPFLWVGQERHDGQLWPAHASE